MRIWAMAASLAAAGLSQAQAANVVGDGERLWPTRTIDFVVCDEAGISRLGSEICKPQFRLIRPAGERPRLGDTEAVTVRAAVDRWNVEFGDNIRLREVHDAPASGHYIVFRTASRPDRCSTRGIGFSRDQERKYISIGSHCNPRVSPEGTTSGSVLHEIMHAIGVYHEHQRFDRFSLLTIDRDEPVTRQWQPICTPSLQVCEEDERTALAVGPYDFGSIMHYGLDPAAAGAEVQLTRAGTDRLNRQRLGLTDVGQRDGFSPIDIRAVELLYPAQPTYAGLGSGSRTDPGRRSTLEP